MITTKTLFRGVSIGENQGPYMSQFLLKDFSYGAINLQQIFRSESDNCNSITDSGWLSLQNGIVNDKIEITEQCRQYNGRTLGSSVHNDPFINFIIMHL